MKRILTGYLLVFIAITNSPAQGRGVGAESTSQVHLLQAAVDASDIQAPGSPSFRLDATVELTPSNSKTIQGKYELLWVNEHKWREEIVFPGYYRLRVGDAESYWQVRTTDFEVPRVHDLTDTLDFAAKLMQDIKDPDTRVTDERSEPGTKCVKVRGNSDSAMTTERKFCFDVATGVLMSNKEGGGVNDITRQEYSGYEPFAGKRFPRMLKEFSGSKQVVIVAITDLAEYRPIDLAKFVTPQDSHLWGYCRTPTHPRRQSLAAPIYPDNEKLAHREGYVRVYAAIAEDGTLQNFKVLEATSQDFAAFALSAMQKWKFEPATCSGKPIKQEVFLEVIFRIR